MSTGSFEQRNPYKGSPPRPWLRLRVIALDGTIQELDLLADTGNPCAIIISQANMLRLKQADAPDMSTNFGLLEGGWLNVAMQELGLNSSLVGYASDMVVGATQGSSLDFDGLAGLPLLRMVEYGGDADWFWLRPAPSPP